MSRKVLLALEKTLVNGTTQIANHKSTYEVLLLVGVVVATAVAVKRNMNVEIEECILVKLGNG
jgi:hypothetical protein